MIFVINLFNFHKNNSKNEIELIHSNIASSFESYLEQIRSSLKVIVSDEKLIANLNLLKTYSSLDDTSFEDIRQSMALDLVVTSQMIKSDFFVIFDSNNLPVVFSNSSKMSKSEEFCIGYALYKQNERLLYTKPLAHQGGFSHKTTQSSNLDFFTSYATSQHDTAVSIVSYGGDIFLNINKYIKNKSDENIGKISTFTLIDSELMATFETVVDLSVITRYQNIIYALSPSLENFKSDIQNALFKEDDKITIENKTFYIDEKELGNGLSIVYLSTFSTLQKEVDSLKNSVFISIIVLLFVLVPFGYFIIKKYVNFPIEKLLEDIQSFKQTNSVKNKNLKLNDEFGLFQRVFYDMTDIILNKETELYLKTQEQKLANKELENIVSQLKAYQIALDETSIVSKSDLDGRITYVNDKLCERTGYTKQELIGKAHSIFKHQDTPQEEFRRLWATITSGNIYKGVIKNRKKDGGGYYVKTTIVPIFDNSYNIKEYIAVRNDITDIMNAKKDLEDSYYKDMLTKLPNRNQLLLDISKIHTPKLVLLNIDSFKEINDFYGHSTGDEILLLVSQKIKSFFDAQSRVYKMPSDEYALVFDHDVSDEEIQKEVVGFIEEISDTYFSIDSIEISVNLTAGLALNSTNDEVLKDADIALKTAKKSSILLKVCDETSKVEAENYKNNILWAHKLKAAIKEDRIVPFYQPIFNNQTQKIEKYEVLMRLIEHNRPITPWFFLDIAKKSKQYKKLTMIMIEKSFAYFSDKEYEFSINLSAEDIESDEIKDFIIKQLDMYDNIRQKVVFEIVESEGFKNFDNVIEFIKQAKIKGCKIAIDDFGTGYSNFEYLLKLKADYVKIDGSLIKNINHDKDAFEVVKIIVQFAKSQGMKTIAEFVSNFEIQKIMAEIGVDYSQGYYIAEPNPTVVE